MMRMEKKSWGYATLVGAVSGREIIMRASLYPLPRERNNRNTWQQQQPETAFFFYISIESSAICSAIIRFPVNTDAPCAPLNWLFVRINWKIDQLINKQGINLHRDQEVNLKKFTKVSLAVYLSPSTCVNKKYTKYLVILHIVLYQ